MGLRIICLIAVKSRCQGCIRALMSESARSSVADWPTDAARRVVASHGRAHHLEAVRRHRAHSSGIDGQQATSDALKSPTSWPFTLTHLPVLLCSVRSPSPSQPLRRAHRHSPSFHSPISRARSSVSTFPTVSTLQRPHLCPR